MRVGDDERSVRCGFREFRFENGFFRLNGRRIFLRSTHTCNHFPVGLKLPPDPDMARRDLLDLKVMGFNMIRFIWGGAERSQLDLCDEIGLMVYEESFASWPMQDSPKLAERWERSISELIRRDRNHPSVVIWGLLNEVRDTPHFRLAAASLPLVRQLDQTRMVFLNSGRWDLAGVNDEVFSKLDIWHSEAGREPWATLNPSTQPVETPFNFTWPPRQVALHPGPRGEYSVVRWTAPMADRYNIAATFTGLFKATTDVHLFHNGRPQFVAQLNIGGSPNTATHTSELALAKGDTIDFVVGWGNGNYGSDSTALTATIQSATGRLFDLAADFPREKNPAGPWSCGWLAPGDKADPATFALYTESRYKSRPHFGSLANPGSVEWEDVVADQHHYPRVPHTAATIQGLRNLTGGNLPLFLSEYGIGSAVDLWRTTRHFERLGKTEVEDAQFYRDKLDRYLADWKRWKLDELYARAGGLFRGEPAQDGGPAHARPQRDPLQPEHCRLQPHWHERPRQLRRRADDDVPRTEARHGGRDVRGPRAAAAVPVRRAGECLSRHAHPLRGGVGQRRRAGTWRISGPTARGRPAEPAHLREDRERDHREVNRPSRCQSSRKTLWWMARRAGIGSWPPSSVVARRRAAKRSSIVADPAEMPAVETEVMLAGDDAELAKWLGDHGIRCRAFAAGEPSQREVILVSKTPPAFEELWRRVERGATAVFLSPDVLKKGDQSLGWLPLANKGTASPIRGWLYLKDEWAKRHPIFDGLPAGGLMDYTFYREIIPDTVLAGQDPPVEAVAGAIKASQDYSSGLMLAVYESGAGRFVLNTLLIRENLGANPVAERLLRNLLNYAAGQSKATSLRSEGGVTP